MTRRVRHFWIACLYGIVTSVVLLRLYAGVNPDHHPVAGRIVFIAQFPGWLACAYLLPGSFESTSLAHYVEIGIPVNAAVYAIIIFLGAILLERGC